MFQQMLKNAEEEVRIQLERDPDSLTFDYKTTVLINMMKDSLLECIEVMKERYCSDLDQVIYLDLAIVQAFLQATQTLNREKNFLYLNS